MMSGSMTQYGEDSRYSGYLATPENGVGPGVLVLHAWWGLNDFFKSLCDRLAAEGYIAFAPDLYGGKVAATIEDAERLAQGSASADMETAALEAVRFLVRQPGARPIGIGVIGFSMGASYAALLSEVRAATVRAVVVFYGAAMPDYTKAKASYLCHFCEEDEWESREWVDAMAAALKAADRPATFHFYGAGHWFFEANRPDAYEPAAAELAWERTKSFLAQQLSEKDEPLPRDADELMARINEGWDELQAAIAGRSEEQLTTPGPEGWSAREHLAHVTFWERFTLLSHIGGQPAAEVTGMDEATIGDFDASNAIVADRTRTRALSEVLAEGRELHTALVAKLISRPFAEWMRPRFADDPDERPLMLWIAGNTYGHYGEHAGYIRGLLGN